MSNVDIIKRGIGIIFAVFMFMCIYELAVSRKDQDAPMSEEAAELVCTMEVYRNNKKDAVSNKQKLTKEIQKCIKEKTSGRKSKNK